MFWSVLNSLTQEQIKLFLKFVTSCERPPSLGFSMLNPPFTIQKVALERNEKKLITSSTCFNLLKLPDYPSYKDH